MRTGAAVAAISAALALAPVIIETVQGLVTEGEIDADALKEGGLDAIGAGTRGFISGSVSAALTTAAQADMLPFLSDLSPAVIAVIAVIATRAVEGSIEVAAGRMTTDELAVSLAQTSLVAIASQVGGAVGQCLIPAPVISFIIGSLVGSVVGNLTVSAAGQLTLALCVRSGVTLFGLVDQDFVLPESVLDELGLSTFDFDEFAIDEFAPDAFVPEAFSCDGFKLASFDMGFIRRGVIGVRKVGYLG